MNGEKKYNPMFFRLFWTFLKIGTFTLGGGYAMLPLIQKEVVDTRHWIDEPEFLNMIALAQAAPGIIAVNSAIFIGYRVYGWRGLIAAVLGAVLPSFCIILAIAALFRDYKDLPAVEAVFRGVRPAVVALIAAPLFKMTRNALRATTPTWDAGSSSRSQTAPANASQDAPSQATTATWDAGSSSRSQTAPAIASSDALLPKKRFRLSTFDFRLLYLLLPLTAALLIWLAGVSPVLIILCAILITLILTALHTHYMRKRLKTRSRL
ncbi:MAG: chromate transporter [Paludibacteraceae bacterium]|nr:chromate transporter [Paludibacteraceae bacterium]